MNNRYLITSLLGGLIGALMVLMVGQWTDGHPPVVPGEIHVICDNHAQLEEQVNSLQKRIDDMYVFAGVVVTLLLAINVGVYVRAANQINDYIKDNFKKHEIELVRIVENANGILDELENEGEFREKSKKIRRKYDNR